MAIGAGWQVSVALINIGCYYIVGLPIGAILGYKFKHGARGIWIGMLIGCLVQTLVLLYVIFRTNWRKEVTEFFIYTSLVNLIIFGEKGWWW